MVREVMWRAWDGPGLGHLRLAVRESGVAADGLVLGVTEGRPFRLAYEVRCDARWRVRAARVGVPGEPPKVELFSDGEGNWTGPDGRDLPHLRACAYVDVSETLRKPRESGIENRENPAPRPGRVIPNPL